MFAFLRPDPHIPELEDAEEVTKKYQYFRLRILYSTFIGYALFYLTRKSVTFVIPALIEMGYTLTEIGVLSSTLYITYGISKFVSGVQSDRSNPRYFMAIGLMITGVCNILFGMATSFTVLVTIWAINGWFQGWGWPPCARCLTHWYSHSERGSWWAAWNISHNVGSFLSPWIAGFFIASTFGWRYALFVPGVLCIFGALFLINRLRDTPQSLGLPSVEKWRNDYPLKKTEEDMEREQTTKEILFDHVLKNKYIWLLCLASFFVYIVRTAVNDWTAYYLIEEKGYSVIGANGCVSLFEVGGFFGSLIAGFSSDLLFQARRGPVIILFTAAMLLGFFFLWSTPLGLPFLDSLSMIFMGVATFGPQMLLGILAAEISHKKAAATSTGLAGWFAYIGAAVSGYPLSVIIQKGGWNLYFMTMGACCLFALLLLLPMWGVEVRRYKRAVEQEAEKTFA